MNWMAPEITRGVQYSKAVDVWSFGSYAYELATGNPPYYRCGRDRKKLLDHIRNEEVDPIPQKWSESFKDFINKCLIKDPKQRWTIE